MVYLNRISTGSGDEGETSLGDGTRVPKTHPRIAACGAVDELNSVIGVALSVGLPEAIAERLRKVQNDLFDLGADLCVPIHGDSSPEHKADSSSASPLRVSKKQVERLDRWIEKINETLRPLTSFVLPGGTPASARLHHARAVCRRVEIDVRRLAETEPVNPHVSIYLNRLSDLLFVMARACNNGGRNDLLWTPGGEGSPD